MHVECGLLSEPRCLSSDQLISKTIRIFFFLSVLITCEVLSIFIDIKEQKPGFLFQLISFRGVFFVRKKQISGCPKTKIRNLRGVFLRIDAGGRGGGGPLLLV